MKLILLIVLILSVNACTRYRNRPVDFPKENTERIENSQNNDQSAIDQAELEINTIYEFDHGVHQQIQECINIEVQ